MSQQRFLALILGVTVLAGISLGAYLGNDADATDVGQVKLGIRLPGIEEDPASLVTFEQGVGNGVFFTYPKRYLDWPEALPTTMLNAFHAQGRVPEITWQPWTNGVGISYDAILNGDYDAYITSIGQGLAALNYPVWMNFLAEGNGDWSPWSTETVGNSREKHKQVFRHVVDLVRAQGATNVSWVWTPNVRGFSAPAPYSEIYPGDAYVDYAGLDGYNWGTGFTGGSWVSFRGVFQASYDELASVSSRPIVIMEVGCAEIGGSKEAWIRDMARDIPLYFPRLYAFSWFNKNREADWRFDSTPESKAAFAEVFGNQATPSPSTSPSSNASARPSSSPSATATSSATPTAASSASPTSTAVATSTTSPSATPSPSVVPSPTVAPASAAPTETGLAREVIASPNIPDQKPTSLDVAEVGVGGVPVPDLVWGLISFGFATLLGTVVFRFFRRG